MTDWLIDDSVDSGRIAPALAAAQVATRGAGDADAANAALVVRLHDLVVHNNHKWITFLGGADVRVDLVVVQGNVLENDPTTWYTPTTLRFESVGDGDSLPVDEQGILAYYGWPKHFLDISVIVSRDTAHSDDLSALLSRSAANPEVKTALSALIGVAVAVPPAAAVAAALTAAATIGNVAYQAVRSISSKSIGLYRGNRLAFPDRFGVGRNPRNGSYRQQDLSFWYEVIESAPREEEGVSPPR